MRCGAGLAGRLSLTERAVFATENRNRFLTICRWQKALAVGVERSSGALEKYVSVTGDVLSRECPLSF